MSKLKMTCGYCGRKCDLDKDFCIPQDSVYVCKSCYDWQNKISDLEAKLAEYKEQVEIVEKQHSELLMTIFDGHKENFELKQQLAEKEKEIKSLSSEISSLEQDLTHYKGEVYNLKDQLAEEETRIAELEKILEDTTWTLNDKLNEIGKADQDKISFALERLEKVKEKALHFYVNDTPKLTGFYIDVNEIDNQIEELKKEMK